MHWVCTHAFQIAAALVGTGHLCVFSAYFFAYGIPDDLMVSEEIFDYHAFRDAMTALTALEFAILLCYSARIYAADALGGFLMCYGVTTAFAGWCTLAYNQVRP